MLMVSHSPGVIRSYCRSGLVLEGGEATYFEDVEDAIAQHERNMAGLRAPPAGRRLLGRRRRSASPGGGRQGAAPALEPGTRAPG